VLDQLVRDVVERRVQLVADALHRADGGNGDERRDQAVLNGGRALLVVLNQLQKLAHGLVSLVPGGSTLPLPLGSHIQVANAGSGKPYATG